jgi:predicted KAP-like P-loop ATPase
MAEIDDWTNMDVGSDSPKVDPMHDAYGYVPFAERIANAIKRTPSPQGLVMAIHGQWGAGKSTLLNFVKHFLERRANDRIVVIDFNPWWFDDRNQLAAQFLSQFKLHLRGESEQLRNIGDLMSEYSSAIGTAVSVSCGVQWIDVPLGALLKLLKRQPKDVPKLKSEIAKKLHDANQRFLFVVDDIDRLTPDEIRELFKVIKALADFPNVIYLLSFDRDVVAAALSSSLKVDGEAYLEKIVQVPFSLPAVDRLRLRAQLFANLDEILAVSPSHPFDAMYWQNVYFDGLDQFINKPRDVIRIANALRVTYPAVAGEVNAVDYISLEFLRLFDPSTYAIIRDNSQMFVGGTDGRRDELDPLRVFHDSWLAKVPERRRASTQALISRVFPKAGAAWGGSNHGGDWVRTWRAELRACAADVFDVYFQFGVASDDLSRAELNQILAVAETPELAMQILVDACDAVRPDGGSKASDYIDRLRDLQDELTPSVSRGLLIALFQIGDRLLCSDERRKGMMAVPRHWRLGWLLKHLLLKIPPQDRVLLLRQLVVNGAAIGLSVSTVGSVRRYLDKPDDSSSPYVIFDEAGFQDLKANVIDRLSRTTSDEFLHFPEAAMILYSWERWGAVADVRAKLAPLFASEEKLPKILDKFKQVGSTQTWGDQASTRTVNLNPNDISELTDIHALEPLVVQMLTRPDLTPDQAAVGKSYLRNIERIRQGQDPRAGLDD